MYNKQQNIKKEQVQYLLYNGKLQSNKFKDLHLIILQT